MHARIQIYWCRSSIFRHLKLELLTQFPASNDEKYINVVYIWRKFVSFYGYVHWRMTTEISVMYGSEKVKCTSLCERIRNGEGGHGPGVPVLVSDPGIVSSRENHSTAAQCLVRHFLSGGINAPEKSVCFPIDFPGSNCIFWWRDTGTKLLTPKYKSLVKVDPKIWWSCQPRGECAGDVLSFLNLNCITVITVIG